ncbi:ABC membrane domain containing protein [Asbolus verrucosus]|uniref:ABC membrane domain containing protein n=1 Tax=Asbolus verrucosus TaxID=1661398 RepID=A0A482W6M5_ASBVE|nr:ABC membrane domain containing protein [Asbolus verrucosus]
MYHGHETRKRVNPKEKANIASLITFFFTYDMLRQGFKKDLEEEDIYEVIKSFKSSKLGDKLEKHWSKQKSKSNTFSIFRLLWSCYGKYYLFWGVIQLFMKIITVMVQPRALGKLVSYFTKHSTMSKQDAIYYALLVIGLNIISCTYAHNYMFIITELGIKVRTAFCSLIYRKSLKLSPASLSDVNIGKIVTLISKDVNSFDAAIVFLNDMWISLILLVITSALIYSRIGVAALAGVLFLVLIIPLQVFFGNLTSNLRIKASKITDQRLQITQETLSAIKIIKMYTWETFFGQNIAKVRKDEIKKIKHIYFAKATSLVIGGLVISITLYIIVMVYTALGNHFTAELAFFLVSCLQALRSSVTISIPIGIAMSAELVASARRIHRVLTAEEYTTEENERTFKPLIEMEKVAVNIRDKTILHDINLKIDSGFHFITGRLGGGKSTLLKTILQDYPICYGQLNVQGKVSYASEEPWLFPSSIKQNILFGKQFDAERYKKVLHVCALEADIATFEKGDSTIVEDRGLNLSKGQQARINLARAVYRNSDIYLLDDCLSALDTHVQEFVFKECILNFLKDKIVLMISHNERQLKEADIIIIVENGTIKSCTKPSDIPDDEIVEIIREEDERKDDDLIDNIHIDDEDTQEDSKLLKPQPKNNIYHEQKKDGKVEAHVYRKYYYFGGGVIVSITIFAIFVIAQAGMTFCEKLYLPEPMPTSVFRAELQFASTSPWFCPW